MCQRKWVKRKPTNELLSKNDFSEEVLFVGLILYVPVNIFQLRRDGSSWVEPVARFFSEKDKAGCFTFVYFCIYVRVFVLCLFLTVPWLVCDL